MKQNDTTVRFDEKLLTAYFAGAVTPDEERMLWEWICASDENRRVFAELRAVWQRGRMQRPDTQLPARFVRSLNGLNRRIDALDAAPVRKGRLIPLRRFAAAAAVAAILVASFMTYRIVTAPFVHSFHNADTVAMHVAMPDGTDVWLSPGTTLSYDDTFRIDGRNVELDGEAYFDVSHDARHPFVVETRELAIRVLGTAFNVRALAGDPLTEVVLERGAVRLETPGGDNLVRLHPNQRAVYDARMGDMEVAEINAPLYVTRRYNLVTMKGATITEIIAGIEKSYGVRIRIMSPDDGKRYDINYLRSNSLEEVVDIVEFMTGTHCEVIRNE